MDIRGCHGENRRQPLLRAARVTPAFQTARWLRAGSLWAGFSNAQHLLNGFSSLTAFFSHVSTPDLSAVHGPVPPTLLKAKTRKEKRKRDANAFARRCYKPTSDRLFIYAGLSWRCLDAFIRVDIHPSNNRPCLPKKARVRHSRL